MDELLQSVKAYERLLKKSYDIVLGKKETAENIHIEFREDGFHHLIGLQYLQQNMPELRKNKENIFYKILKDKKFRDKIEKASEYDEILGRVISVNHLEQLLDSTDTEAYKCNKGRGSSIEADYMLKGKVGSDTIYFFIRESKNERGIYQGCSIFPEEKQKSGHSYMKVLYKVKHDLSGIHELYISSNYKPQSGNNIMHIRFDNPLDNPLSDIQTDNTLAVPDSFRKAFISLTERLGMFMQNIADKIQKTLTTVLSKPQDIDTAPPESAPANENAERNPDDDRYYIIMDNAGIQSYGNYITIISANELDFNVPITYETEQIQKKQDMEQEIPEEKTPAPECREKQSEYDDL